MLIAHEGDPVGEGVQRPLQAGPHRGRCRGAAPSGTARGGDPVGRAREIEQVDAFCLIELQSGREGVQHRGGGSGDRAALELGVVLDADPGEHRRLAATQTGHATVPARGQPRILRRDLRATGHEELAHLCSVVHEDTIGRRPRRRPAPGVPCGYTPRQELPGPRRRRCDGRAPPRDPRSRTTERPPCRSDPPPAEGVPHARSHHARPRRRPRRGARGPAAHRPDRRRHPPHRHLHLRLGPVALPRRRPARPPAHGPRVRGRGRGDRRGGHHARGGRLRGRLLRDLLRAVRDLPRGPSLPLCARGLRRRRDRHPGREGPHPLRQRHPGEDPRTARGGPDPLAAGRLRRAGHRLVRGRRRRSPAPDGSSPWSATAPWA